MDTHPINSETDKGHKRSEVIPHGIEREGGRGNGSFPVAEILKPLGFRKFCEYKIL